MGEAFRGYIIILRIIFGDFVGHNCEFTMQQ